MPLPPKELSAQFKLGINLLGNISTNYDNEVVYDKMLENGISSSVAIDLLLFAPTIFTRILIPSVPWCDYYIEVENNNRTKIKYSDKPSYGLIWELSTQYTNECKDKNALRNIAKRSSEFDAMEKYLMDGGEIENAEILPTEIHY